MNEETFRIFSDLIIIEVKQNLSEIKIEVFHFQASLILFIYFLF